MFNFSVTFFNRMSEMLGEETSTVSDNGSAIESVLRKRNPWNSLVTDSIDLLADVDELDDEEEEDGVGCPLPSTPEDNQLLEAEVKPYLPFNLSFHELHKKSETVPIISILLNSVDDKSIFVYFFSSQNDYFFLT